MTYATNDTLIPSDAHRDAAENGPTRGRPLGRLLSALVTALLGTLALSGMFGSGAAGAAVPQDFSVMYRAHVQNIGWQASVADGDFAGTTDRGLRLEALTASVNQAQLPGAHLCYSLWVNNAWSRACDGAVAGTTGQSLRSEGLQVTLDGAPGGWGVCYQTYLAYVGWTGAACDGGTAGQPGMGRQVEGLRIWLTPHPIAAGESSSATTAVFGRTVVCVKNLSSTQYGSFRATSFTTVVATGIAPGATDCTTLNRAWVGFDLTVVNTTPQSAGVRLAVYEPYGHAA